MRIDDSDRLIFSKSEWVRIGKEAGWYSAASLGDPWRRYLRDLLGKESVMLKAKDSKGVVGKLEKDGDEYKVSNKRFSPDET
jgi:hypothetical protein